MKPFLDALKDVYENGVEGDNRTKFNTKAKFGTMCEFDLQKGFPAVTTKRLFFKSVSAELAAFLKGGTSLEYMNQFGTKIWDQNVAAESWQNNPKCKGPDYLGKIYGYQWRNWQGDLDQLAVAVDTIKNNPTSRRIIVTAWQPSELDEMCLPPCHILYQFNVREGKYLDCMFLMRSLDMFLGAPFDIASYALLTHIVAQQTGLMVGKLVMTCGNAHIYNNHYEQVEEQLSRTPFDLPILQLAPGTTIDNFHPSMVSLLNYQYHPSIKAEMAV